MSAALNHHAKYALRCSGHLIFVRGDHLLPTDAKGRATTALAQA